MSETCKSVLRYPQFSPKNRSSMFRGNQKSAWNFWKHGVTSSFLSSYLTCREQTRLHYVEGYSSRHVPIYFEFGTCCHWILEQAYAKMEKGFGQPYDTDVQWHVRAYHRNWLADTKMPSQKQLDQQELVYGMAEAILPSYFERWSGDFTGEYKHANQSAAPAKWLSLEEVFEVPYTYPDGQIVPLRGRRDGVFLDKKGFAWVFDTKCRSVINDDDTMDTFSKDLQQMFYLWVSRVQFLARKAAAPVGTLLNNIRRPGHRQGKQETMQEFLLRIKNDVSNPRRFDHFFIRYQMRIMDQEILDWKKQVLDPLMVDVRLWWEGKVPHYCNTNNLVTKYGRCSMFLPIVTGDTSICYRREKVFPELPEIG